MFRLLFSFVVSVVLARWMYSEVELSFPRAIPVIQSALDVISIPTHDKWDTTRLEKLIAGISSTSESQTTPSSVAKDQTRAASERKLKEIL